MDPIVVAGLVTFTVISWVVARRAATRILTLALVAAIAATVTFLPTQGVDIAGTVGDLSEARSIAATYNETHADGLRRFETMFGKPPADAIRSLMSIIGGK